MLIYKIFRQPEWQAFQATGTTQGAPIDVQDGFVHFSTALQAAETAAKHFAGVRDLVLVAIDTDRLKHALRWEKSRNDDLFPHFYGRLTINMVLWAEPLPLEAGQHKFPATMV